jgi:type IV secretion system protein TrbG
MMARIQSLAAGLLLVSLSHGHASPAEARATKARSVTDDTRHRAAQPPSKRLLLPGRRAVHEPSASAYVNAAQVYAFEEGALYRLYAAPELVSDLALEPGEKLISVAAGDTARWIIGDTTSGSGANARTHILVKPSAAGLRTNLVITTDRRVYLLMVESTSGGAMPAISWTYPEDELVALQRARDDAEAAVPVASAISVDRLNFGYEIKGDRPEWRPLRAFDDGTQVFIEFPPLIAVGEAPPLFVIGEEGKAELVNFRMRGRYYVVDRLFRTAELRLGEKHQAVVRITRTDTRHKGRRG